MTIKVTIEKTFSHKPDSARRCLSLLSCIDGAKASAAQIVERLDDSGNKTIRIPFIGSEHHLFDQIRDVLLQHADEPSMPLFDSKRELQVGDRVRIGEPLKGDSDIYEGREGVVISIADEVDVRFDLGYAELSGLFPMERLEVIPPHELQVGDVVKTVAPDGDSALGIVNRIDEETGNAYYMLGENEIMFNKEFDRYVRPSRLCVGDAVLVATPTPLDLVDGIERYVISSFDVDPVDGSQEVFVDSGKSSFGSDQVTLDLEALAVRVSEQEDLIAAIEAAAQKPMESCQCERCDGCGQIANDEDGTPWSKWEKLPQESRIAMNMGLVKPIPCPDCNGTGKNLAPVSHDADLFEDPIPGTDSISDEDLDKAMELFEAEGRLNPILVQRTFGWGLAQAMRVIAKLRELGRIPCPGDPTEEQTIAVDEMVNA